LLFLELEFGHLEMLGQKGHCVLLPKRFEEARLTFKVLQVGK